MPRKSPFALIDSHVHTDDPRFSSDIETILATARQSNIVAQVVPAVSQQYWTRLKQLCDNHNDLFPCFGLHPYYHREHTDAHLDELTIWLEKESTVAVGECGLDYAISDLDKPRQQHVFATQLDLARAFDLPVVIHAVRAVEDVIQMIRASGHNKGMVHSFNGSEQQAKTLIDHGYYIGLGGAVTHARAKRLHRLVAQLPLDALLLETDAPDQPPATYKKQRNEPAYLVDVWQAISELRSDEPEVVAERTTANAQALFGINVTVN